MLGLEFEELTTLTVKEVVSKLQKLGMSNPIKYIDNADYDVYASMYATSLSSEGKSIDFLACVYSFNILELLTDYMYSSYWNGADMDIVEKTVNRILDLYEEKLEVNSDGILYGMAGKSVIDVGAIRKMIPIIKEELDGEIVGLTKPKQYALH